MDRPTTPHRIDPHAPDGTGLEPWDAIDPAELVSGSPVQRGTLCDEIAGAGYIAGVWDCTAQVAKPGPYEVDEFMYLLDGTVIMGLPDGSEVTVNAGEAFVIPKGLECQWKQPGYVRKIFMILDGPAAMPACNLSLARVSVPDLGPLPLPEDAVTASRTDFVNAAGTMEVSLSQHAATTSAARTAPANEVICVLDGSLTLTHGETQEVHAKGAAVYLPQGCVTGWQTDEGTRLLISRYCG